MATRPKITVLSLFPPSARVNQKGHLVLGGCDAVALAEEFGTPLYVFDERGLRDRCAEFKKEFGRRCADVTVLYAAKAFTPRAMLALVKEEGLGLDVVSGGELGIARSVDFPMNMVSFPGNNKSAEELEMALECGIGHIVVDNFHELNLLRGMAGRKKASILLRLSPGIDAHTHKYNTTGTVDSKFGFTRSTWEKALTTARGEPNLKVDGLHFHIGSGIFETEPYRKSIEVVLEFAAAMKKKHGFVTRVLSVGGGYGVPYTLGAEPPSVSAWAELITGELTSQCRQLGLSLPRLIIEPGRAIVARAGVALYRVGAIKDIPGIRRYVSVDGGMGDNIRYAMYGARHEAVLANKVRAEATDLVTISGKYCESGDILITDIKLPPVEAGDLLAVADCGAYCVPMQSNYNASFRPAIIFVRDGKARLVRRRETLEDLTRCDLI
ncbi:MAG: diaminopimelate decarboxylase [Chloroflexota bacterium]